MTRNDAQPNNKGYEQPPIADDSGKAGIRGILLLHLDGASPQAIPKGVKISNLAEQGPGCDRQWMRPVRMTKWSLTADNGKADPETPDDTA